MQQSIGTREYDRRGPTDLRNGNILHGNNRVYFGRHPVVAILKVATNILFLSFTPVLLPLFLAVRSTRDAEKLEWLWSQSLWLDFWEGLK